MLKLTTASMDYLNKKVEEVFGPKCDTYEEDCGTCIAHKMLDLVQKNNLVEIGQVAGEPIFIQSDRSEKIKEVKRVMALMMNELHHAHIKVKQVGILEDDWDKPMTPLHRFIFGALGWILLGVVLTLLVV